MGDAWSAPVELGPAVNGGFFENSPYLSADGQALYFSAVRPDRIGSFDLYVTTRTTGNVGR